MASCSSSGRSAKYAAEVGPDCAGKLDREAPNKWRCQTSMLSVEMGAAGQAGNYQIAVQPLATSIQDGDRSSGISWKLPFSIIHTARMLSPWPHSHLPDRRQYYTALNTTPYTAIHTPSKSYGCGPGLGETSGVVKTPRVLLCLLGRRGCARMSRLSCD